MVKPDVALETKQRQQRRDGGDRFRHFVDAVWLFFFLTILLVGF